VRRQQTLRASVDWSHALLTEPERVLFRRLAVFMGGLDLDAAQAIAAASDVERFQVLDQLSLLVDKSLVVAEETAGRMRYRMLETVRQYALEKLGESGEADAVRTRHRDYYTATAAMLESLTRSGANQVVAWAQVEIDNLRAAFMWCRENSEFEPALGLVSSLQGFWQACGRFREGLAGFDAILDDECFRESDVARAVWVRAIAERSALAGWVGAPPDADLAQQALTIARELDDPALLATALIGCALARMDSDPVAAQPYFVEAGGLVRALGDWQRLCVILNFQGFVGNVMGDAEASLTAATEGRDVADAQGDAFNSRGCRVWIGMALMMQGRLADAASELRSVIPEADAANDLTTKALGLVGHGVVLAYQGHADAARSAAAAALEATTAMGGFHEDTVYVVFANAALAHGDSAAAKQAAEACWQHTLARREIFIRSINPHPEALLACGELTAARRWADEAVASVPGWHRLSALNARARIAIAQGDPEQAERDLYDAISLAAAAPESIHIPDTLECLSGLLTDADNCQSAARLFGAADAIRRHTGEARFAVYQAGHEGTVAKLRDALGEKDFEAAWAEGAALSTEEAIAYAQRGRGERKRPSTGWGSLTPTELDVVRQLQDGLGNKEIATRLFISPRTVQTHLTHVYSKLGITSRVQLAQEAARHN
jgi:DNA-binding CsgD family transcriptional regulator